jgi:hypothetical protein
MNEMKRRFHAMDQKLLALRNKNAALERSLRAKRNPPATGPLNNKPNPNPSTRDCAPSHPKDNGANSSGANQRNPRPTHTRPTPTRPIPANKYIRRLPQTPSRQTTTPNTPLPQKPATPHTPHRNDGTSAASRNRPLPNSSNRSTKRPRTLATGHTRTGTQHNRP